jgi:hypothetical protein
MVRDMAASIVPPMSRSDRLVRRGRQLAGLSLALLFVGPSILLVEAWVEVLNHPGYSLVDGYSIGRLPWTPIGIALALAGAVLALGSGSALVAIIGGWWRRLLIVPVAAAAAIWWAFALGLLPFPRFHGPDPVTFAYDLPTTAAILVLLPGAFLAALALSPRPPDRPTTRLRPLRPRERDA